MLLRLYSYFIVRYTLSGAYSMLSLQIEAYCVGRIEKKNNGLVYCSYQS
jgi:hypothetical protein